MTTNIVKAKVACMLPFYLNEQVFSDRVKNIEATQTGAVAVEKDSVSKKVTLRLKRFEIGCEKTSISATCDPSIVVYMESFLPNRHVAILVLIIEFSQLGLELNILLRFLNDFRRLQTDRCFSIKGLSTDPLQLQHSPKNIVQFLLDTALPVREMVEGINKMISLHTVVMTTEPSEDDLYKLATISDPDEVLTSDYVQEFLQENAYRRWKNAGSILIFHRNAGAFVIDGSNKHFMEWIAKDPTALEKSIDRRIHSAGLLVFQKAVLYQFRYDIRKNFRKLRFDKDRQKLLARIEDLREHILQFTNQYRYSEEIEDSTMAVEIMKIWRRVMLVDALFFEIYEKLSELEQYMVTITTNDQTRAISWLQIFFVAGTAGSIAVSLLIPTSNLMISIFGTAVIIVSFGFLTWIWLKRSNVL